jgi:hypothetical protein
MQVSEVPLMLSLRLTPDALALQAGIEAAANSLRPVQFVAEASLPLKIALGVVVVTAILAAVYEKHRANIVTVSLPILWVLLLNSEVSLSRGLATLGDTLIAWNPTATLAGAILAAAGIAAVVSGAERTRSVMAGGAVAFLLALLAGDALLAILIQRGAIGEEVLRPYGWSRRAGLQLGIAVGIIVIVGPVVLRASSRIRRRRARGEEDQSEAAASEPDDEDEEEEADPGADPSEQEQEEAEDDTVPRGGTEDRSQPEAPSGAGGTATSNGD